MTADNIHRIEDITVQNLKHQNRSEPSVAAVVDCDGSTYGVPLLSHHPLRYLFETLDQGEFRVELVEDELIYWVQKDSEQLNSASLTLLGEDTVGTIVVTPKVLNFGLYSGFTEYARPVEPLAGPDSGVLL